MREKKAIAVKAMAYLLIATAAAIYSRQLLFSLVFILIHELTHIIVGIFLGYKFKKTRLLSIGTNAVIEEEFVRPLDDLAISISGPLMNFVFFCVLSLPYSSQYCYISSMAKTNLILCIFNLMPAAFLDGGRIVKCILKQYVSYFWAYTVSAIGGVVTGTVLVLGIIYYKLTINGIIIFSLGIYIFSITIMDMRNFTIGIIKDEIYKQLYIGTLKNIRSAGIIAKGSTKLIDVIKHFSFGRYYKVTVFSKSEDTGILYEEQIYLLYCSCGNITLDECLLIIKDTGGLK